MALPPFYNHPFGGWPVSASEVCSSFFYDYQPATGAPGLAGFETRASATHYIGKLVGLMVLSFGTLH
jgi:hypothetical protein